MSGGAVKGGSLPVIAARPGGAYDYAAMPTNRLLPLLGISMPLIQAPMAGVSSPEMAAAVSDAGALGSIAVGAGNAEAARNMIRSVRSRTDRPFNVNLFCHAPAAPDPAKEAAWTRRFAPLFAEYGAEPPTQLREIYRSFLVDDAMLQVLLEERPAVVSFHFGLPSAAAIAALKQAGIVLLASATNLAEAHAVAAAGLDAVVAQGWEAGGHRGVFDPDAADEMLGTCALVRLIAATLDIPVIAAGGIMDGRGIAAALALGAAAAQLGTAFIACDESLADAGYRAALVQGGGAGTVMTRMVSGRPARILPNRFAALNGGCEDAAVPAYPIAYDLGKALHAAAKARGEHGYGAHWAGQGAPLLRSMTAAELVRTLGAELAQALAAETLPG